MSNPFENWNESQPETGLKAGIICLAGLLVVIWGVEIVNLFMQHRLCAFGILPRTWSGLWGVPFSPFIHSGLKHAAVNTVPLLVMAGLIMLRGLSNFMAATLIIIVAGGLSLWLFGRPAYHVGASGLIFGYFGYLLASGWYARSFTAILVAALTLLLYGGVLWGLLPTHPSISFEGHLFGLLAGIGAARILQK